MKKLLLLFMLFVTGLSLYGQKITNLTATTSAAGTNNIMTAATGSDQIKRITKAQFLVDYAVLASPTFTTQITIGANAITEAEAGYLDFTSSGQGQFNAIVAEQIDTVNLESLTPMLTDTTNLFLFGSGIGLAGDTVLIADALNGYGYYEVPMDSTIINQIKTNIPTGDTVNYYLVSGTTLWTPIDTLATIPAGAGETITTAFSENTYVKGRKIWIEMGAVVLTRKPVMFRALLQGRLLRNE